MWRESGPSLHLGDGAAGGGSHAKAAPKSASLAYVSIRAPLPASAPTLAMAKKPAAAGAGPAANSFANPNQVGYLSEMDKGLISDVRRCRSQPVLI